MKFRAQALAHFSDEGLTRQLCSPFTVIITITNSFNTKFTNLPGLFSAEQRVGGETPWEQGCKFPCFRRKRKEKSLQYLYGTLYGRGYKSFLARCQCNWSKTAFLVTFDINCRLLTGLNFL